MSDLSISNDTIIKIDIDNTTEYFVMFNVILFIK